MSLAHHFSFLAAGVKPVAPRHGLFHRLGNHVAKFWHSLTQGQRHAYTKIHPKSPITKIHKGKITPRHVDHAQAAQHHAKTAEFHTKRAQKAAAVGNKPVAAEHAREAKRHRSLATRHANKVPPTAPVKPAAAAPKANKPIKTKPTVAPKKPKSTVVPKIKPTGIPQKKVKSVVSKKKVTKII